MPTVGGLFENAAIEIQPRQFAIDEAVRALGDSRRRMLRRAFGQPNGRGQAMDWACLEYGGGRLATIGHGYTLLLKPHPDHPRVTIL